MKREDKKGQQMTLGTIIVIVLGILVLVFLIYGFSTGWGNLWDRITNLGGGESNLDTISQACALACTTNAKADYCTVSREIRVGTEVPVGDVEKSTFSATCEDLATDDEYAKVPGLNIEDCSQLCDAPAAGTDTGTTPGGATSPTPAA